MATENNGSGTVNSIFKAVLYLAVFGIGIRVATTTMKGVAADEAKKAADPVIKGIVAEQAAKTAREALAAMDAQEKLKLAGISTTQPATQPAAVLTAGDLVGAWNCSGSTSAGPIAVKFKSVDTYHDDGTWTSVSNSEWTIGKPAFDVPTSFRIVSNAVGTWKIEGNSLVETLTMHEPRPADDVEAAKLAASPRMAKVLLSHDTDNEPVRSQIISVTPTTIVSRSEKNGFSLTSTMTRLSHVPVQTADATR